MKSSTKTTTSHTAAIEKSTPRVQPCRSAVRTSVKALPLSQAASVKYLLPDALPTSSVGRRRSVPLVPTPRPWLPTLALLLPTPPRSQMICPRSAASSAMPPLTSPTTQASLVSDRSLSLSSTSEEGAWEGSISTMQLRQFLPPKILRQWWMATSTLWTSARWYRATSTTEALPVRPIQWLADKRGRRREACSCSSSWSTCVITSP